MADQQQGHAQACLQVLEQFEDFQLHGDVQRGSRLVGNQQLGFVGQGHGNHHALALAAREFVGVSLEALVRLGNADQVEQLQGAGGGRLAAQALMQAQHFVDLLLDAVQRVERGHRLLKHHGDAVAADTAQLGFAHLQQVLAGIVDAAGRMAGDRVGQQAQDRVGGDRFARAALTHQGQGLALADIEADAFDHPLALIAADKFDGQVAHFNQVIGVYALVHLTSSGRRHRVRLRQ